MTPTPPVTPDWPEWLRLVTTPGVSTRQLRQLLSAFGGPAQVLTASEAERAECVARIRDIELADAARIPG